MKDQATRDEKFYRDRYVAKRKAKIEQIAGELYGAYCESVGGKAWNNDPLPNWETFALDLTKRKQSDGYRAMAEKACQMWPMVKSATKTLTEDIENNPSLEYFELSKKVEASR